MPNWQPTRRPAGVTLGEVRVVIGTDTFIKKLSMFQWSMYYMGLIPTRLNSKNYLITENLPLSDYETWADRVEEAPYVFTERPAAKSSTGVLVSTPGAVACPTCGCRNINDTDAHKRTAVTNKKDCTCKCHKGRA